METKKIISQIALGLAVIGFGAGASAFTNKTEKMDIPENYLVQTSLNNFTRANTASGVCAGSAELHCKYEVTPEGKDNIDPASMYDAADIQNFEQQGWIEPANDSSLGLYTP